MNCFNAPLKEVDTKLINYRYNDKRDSKIPHNREKFKGDKKTKKKYFFVILFLILAIFLSSCAGGGIITPSINLTGNWTMTNTTTFTTSTYLVSVGTVTTAKCNIIDSSGSLTLYNFKIIGSEFINWNIGYGTFKNSIITANISGSYLNIYGSTVSTVIYFEGTITPNGISGNGNWTQTLSVYSYFDSASGTTIFIKG